MTSIWEMLENTSRPVVLYGMGNGAEIMVKELAKINVKVAGFFASDQFVRGQSFLGERVLTYREMKDKYPDMIALISFGTQRDEVIENILSLDCEVYAPEVPVVGDTVFTLDFAKQHIRELESVYSSLADERSRKVFEEIVRYKIDGRIEHLIAAEDTEEDVIKLAELGKNETYLDLGAYNGDTVNEFVNNVGTYSRIVALEPDKKNFEKLGKNTATLENVTLINKAIGKDCSDVYFASMGGRNSRIGGTVPVPACSVDSLETAFTYIKMDVEGQEKEALLGSKNTLKAFRPKLRVAAYHRGEDIFDLPLTVKAIAQDYKIYLRHKKYIPAWDTDYFFL